MGWLWVAAGGGLGALLRYGISGWVQGWTASSFPWGTMTVNAPGSLALGAAAYVTGSVATGLVGLVMGMALAGWMLRPRG